MPVGKQIADGGGGIGDAGQNIPDLAFIWEFRLAEFSQVNLSHELIEQHGRAA